MERFAPKPGTSRRLLDSDSDFSDSDSDSDSSSSSAAAEVRLPPRPAGEQQRRGGTKPPLDACSHPTGSPPHPGGEGGGGGRGRRREREGGD